jgi:phage terminase large subunit
MFGNEHYVQIYYGGSSSSKSYSKAQDIVLGCLKGRNYLIIRKVASTLRRSVMNEVVSKIYDLKLNADGREIFKINKTDMVITNVLNNSQILFCGTDDAEKLKSIVPKKGNITDIVIEEATEIYYKDYKAIIKRLRGISQFKKTITLIFNPIIKSHWIYQEFFAGFWEDDKQYMEKEGLSILKTTYKDNRFLAPEDIEALEGEEDKFYYDVYTLGNWGILGAVVFKNWEISNFNPNAFSSYRNGIDWGFSKDPFAFIRIGIDFTRKTIYICNEIYQVGLLNENSSKMVKPFAKREPVYCDNAEPKSIEEYKRFGVNAVAVEKGAGSIEEGIKFLQSFKILVHPDCVNFQNEIRQYKYKENKDGEVLPQLVEKNDHLIDALRYAVTTDLDRKEGRYSRILRARKKCSILKKTART